MGSENNIQQPVPPKEPSVGETTSQAIQAQVSSLPSILQAQQEFGPQFSQLELEQLQEFGPEFAQAAIDLQRRFGPEIGALLRQEQEAAQPELGEARKVLTEYLQQPELLTSEEQRQAQQDIRSAQNVRGFGLESGLGAEDELNRLTQLRQSLKSRRLDIALSTAGRAPVTGASQFQQPSVSPGQLVQNVTPGQIFGLASSNYSTGANIFGTQSEAYAQQQSQPTFASGLGSIIGGGLSSAVGSFGGGLGSKLASKF